MKNLRFLVLFGIIAFLSPSAIAQSKLSFGIFVGANAATQFGDTYSDLGFRFGPAVGLTVYKPYNEKWSFESGIFYSQEGARNGNLDFSSFSDVIYKQTIALDYLTIPILGRFKADDLFRYTFGPRLGLRVRAAEIRKIKSGTPSPTDNSAGTRDLNNRIKLIYPGFMVGGEYDVSDQFTYSFHLYSSFFDNVKRNAGDSEGTYPVMLQVGVNYGLGKK